MKNLVWELKQEHKEIEVRLQNVYALGGNTAESRKELRAVRDMILLHLEREQRLLFAPLERAAQTDASLDKMLRAFADEQATLAEALSKFFGSYDTEKVSPTSFARDFGTMWSVFSSRMRREEANLFAAYLQQKLV